MNTTLAVPEAACAHRVCRRHVTSDVVQRLAKDGRVPGEGHSVRDGVPGWV